MGKVSLYVYAFNIAFLGILLLAALNIGDRENERYRVVNVKSTIVGIDHREYVYYNTGYSRFATVNTRMLMLLEFTFNGITYRERHEFVRRGIAEHKVGDTYAIDIMTKDGKFLEFYSTKVDKRIVFVFGLAVTWLALFIMQLSFLAILDDRPPATKPVETHEQHQGVGFVMCDNCAKRSQQVNIFAYF